MKYTFKSDECMVITIPLGSLRDAQEGQLMPENFRCVFKDVYRVFLKCQPKVLGAAQLIAGVFIFSLGLLLFHRNLFTVYYTMPSVLFIGSGMLTYATGHSPNMCVAKLSFSLNIISFFWTIVAVVLCIFQPVLYLHNWIDVKVFSGINGMIAALLVTEMIIALILIYWESKIVCRQYFNIMPIITIKQEEV